MRSAPLRKRLVGVGGDTGAFAALELTIMVPFIIVMVLLVVAFGRVSRGRQLVDQAAEAAARSASLTSSPTDATRAANQAAAQTLAGGGLSCQAMAVTLDTTQFHAGGQVTAQVRCTTDLAGLTLAGVPGSVTLNASSTAPLETFREFGSGG